MSSSSRLAATLALLATPFATPLAAQPRPSAPTERTVRATIGADAGIGSSYVGDVVRTCGTALGVSGAATLTARLWRVLAVEASHAMNDTWTFGYCVTGIPDASGGGFVPRNVVAGRDPSAERFYSTAVRIGLATPPLSAESPTLRLTAGAGRMWGVAIPFRTLRAAATIGGTGTHWVVAAERWWYGLPVEGDESSVPLIRPLPAPNALRHVRTHATMVRVGFESPIWRR